VKKALFSPHEIPESSHAGSQSRETNTPFTLWDYLKPELVWNIDENLSRVESKTNNKQVKNLFWVPFRLEQFLTHGLLICTDSLLYIFTFLPMRIIYAVCLVLQSMLPKAIRFGRVRRTQIYDLLTAALIVAGVYTISQVHMSIVYHYIRGQAVIKLYVIFNMLEIIDKLFTSLGQG
jgi:hypothetical protein